jgi:hypothetical protein
VRPLSLSLPRRPHLSAVLNLPPTISPSWTAHDRAFFDHVRAPAPYSPTSPLSFASSAQLSRPLSHSTHASRELRHRRRHPLPVLWPLSRPCPIQCHGELHLIVSCSGHPSVCPLPPCCVGSALTEAAFAQPEPHRRRPDVPPHFHRPPRAPEFALEVSTLPMPLFRQVLPQRPHNCSPELAAPPRNLFHRGLRSLAPPCQFYAHGRVRRVALNVSDPFPKPPEPHRGQPSLFQRTLAVGPSGAPRLSQPLAVRSWSSVRDRMVWT